MHITARRGNESSREYALRTLEENIISLELAPGSFISENELSAEMGLSRTPVREALMDLSKVRIIECCPQKKSMVSYIDYSMVDETRFMRNVLECAVVKLVCGLRTEEDLKKLRENVRLQEFCMESNAYREVMELDNVFHRHLFEIAQKPLVYDMIGQLCIHFDRVRNLAVSTVKDSKIVQDHQALIDAIENNQPEKAEAVMDMHLTRYKADKDIICRSYPQYFGPAR